MSSNKKIQLGLCCLNTILRAQKPSVFASRKMIIRTVKEKGIDVLKQKILQNLRDVLTMIDWNEENGIKVFRLSSELFPHKSNPKVEDYSFDFAKDLLRKIGIKAKKYNQRLTFHPGQYNVVGTPNKKSFQQTIVDLKYHADVLDLIDDGTALYQGVAAVFIAQAIGMDLTFANQFTIVATAVLASIGTAAVPGAGIIMLVIILEAINVPSQGIALILGVDRILDMIRTATNVTGDATIACAMDSLEK